MGKDEEIEIDVECRYWIFVFHSMLDVRCSMFDVHLSKQLPYGINATCECLQNNPALKGIWGC